MGETMCKISLHLWDALSSRRCNCLVIPCHHALVAVAVPSVPSQEIPSGSLKDGLCWRTPAIFFSFLRCRPAEIGLVDPHLMQNHGQLARHGDAGFAKALFCARVSCPIGASNGTIYVFGFHLKRSRDCECRSKGQVLCDKDRRSALRRRKSALRSSSCCPSPAEVSVSSSSSSSAGAGLGFFKAARTHRWQACKERPRAR